MGKKILFINQEISPYITEGYMAELGKAFPQKVQEAGFEIRTFMPKWGTINERRGQLHEVIRLSGMNLIIDDTDHPLIIKVASIPAARIQVYFIDNEDYFPKVHPSQDTTTDEEYNNGERAIFFARGVLETVKKLRWVPDVIVCQGWMTSLIPLYIKKAYSEEPSFANAKIISVIYNQQPAKPLEDNFKKSVAFKNVKESVFKPYKSDFDYNEMINMAADYSDGVIVAVPRLNGDISKHLKKYKKPKIKIQAKELTEDHLDFIKSFFEE